MLNQLDQQHLDNYKYLCDPSDADLREEELLNNKPNSPVRNTVAHSLLAYQENTMPNKSSTHFIEERESWTQSVFFNTRSNVFFTLDNDSRRYSSRDEPTEDEKTRDKLIYELNCEIHRWNKDKVSIKQARKNLTDFHKSLRS